MGSGPSVRSQLCLAKVGGQVYVLGGIGEESSDSRQSSDIKDDTRIHVLDSGGCRRAVLVTLPLTHVSPEHTKYLPVNNAPSPAT